MANNLKDHLKEVADAIRAKKGTTDLINPQNFATEIGAISGGGESASTIEYLDVSGLEGMSKAQVIMLAALVGKVNGLIAPTGAILGELGLDQLANISAIATIGDFEVVTLDGVFKIRDVVDNFDSIPRITKEQFYDVNA